MNQRRSLNSALVSTPDLKSPEVQAFISGGAPGRMAIQPPVKELSKKAEEVPHQPVKVAEESPLPESKEAKPKRSAKPQSVMQPLHSKFMISVTTRFEQRTADALRRAHLEQKLKNTQPGTQQEIIELAVQAWLRDNDYLD